VVTIGWLADKPPFVGGTEISSKILLDAIPDWAEVIQCPPDRRPPQVDAFVIQNCLSYTDRWISELEKKPVIKQMRDRWHWGYPVLRRWLLDESQVLIFSSPSHLEHFPYKIGTRWELVPPPIDIKRFMQAAESSASRYGNIWTGRIHPAKGTGPAIDWAIQNSECLDFYGYFGYDNGLPFNIPGFAYYRGKYTQDELPDLLARYERFVFMPLEPESFSRTTVEAWAAGCEMVLDGEIGALWWIENRPGDIERGAELFWEVVKDALAPFT
jgi:hypothetical protein